MEWHQSNSNAAIASPHGQQYLLPSTSSMVANGQSQLPSIQQNSIVHSGSFNSNKDPLLQNLLKAKTDEDFFNIHQAALGKSRSSKPNRLTNQLKSNLHISSYKPAQDLVPIPDNRSTIAVQNTVGSNYRMPTYVNTVHQTSQQPPSVAVGQQFGGNGYNATAVQQPLQSSQALQNFQATVAYSYPQQNNLFNSVRPPANTAQMPCQQMARNMPSSKRYMLQTDRASKKLPAETNISAPNQDCRNVQNITGPSLANYRSLAPNRLLHAPQQQTNVLQTVPQLDGNANYYTQRQNLQNVMVNNSPQMSSAAPATMLPTYAQAVPNSQNCFNASVNQNFSNQRQNYAAPNVQQPAQTGNPPPGQSSVGEEQSRVHDLIASHTRKRDMLKLLLVYRDVRQKYELLNQENNLLRLRLQANTSQDNAGPPPLLSNLPTTQPQANGVKDGTQNITQALPVQNSAQINSARSFHSQNVYDNPVNAANQAGIQHNLPLQENAAVLNQTFKSDNGNHLRQNNYSVFDGGQANVATQSSPLQSLSSETSRDFRGQTISMNQYASSPNSNNGIVLQDRHGLHSLDKPASVTQIPNPACLEKDGYEHLSCTTGSTENGQVMSLSREAIEASLPLWKTVPQSTNRSLESQQNQSQVDPSLAAFRLLDEITSGPTHEVSSTIPVQKQDSAIPNQANPQIAIVSPLVQSKEAFHENYKLSKVHIEDTDIENTTINGLINPRESECFNKILRALESLGANTTNNNIEASRSKEPPVSSPDNVDSSLPSRISALSQTEREASSENVEIDGLQISGICTLVAGNSLYDSSIAMMFEETLDTTALPHTDTRDDHSRTVDTSCISKAPGSTSPKAVTVAIKSEPDDEVPPMTDEVPPMIEGDLHCNRIHCNDMQTDKCMVSAQQESCCDLESSVISDQLTELLTEFPYGIKNYMSEDILESANGPSGKTTDKPVLKASAAPEDFKPVAYGQASAAPEDVKPVAYGQASAAPEDVKPVAYGQASAAPEDVKPVAYGQASAAPEDVKPVAYGQASAAPEDVKPVAYGQASAAPEDFKPVDHRQAIRNTPTEIVPSPSVNLQHVVLTDSETLMDLGPPAEKLSAEVEQTERVSKPANADGNATQVMDTCSDDGFEILSNSPMSNLHITLLDQDEIPKIFPDQNEHVGSEKCNETELGGLPGCANTVEPETESNLLKDSLDVSDAGTDKNLFCCLFSWINLTNKNAPKCNCKQLESTKEVESTRLLYTNTLSIIKTEPSPERPEPTLKGLPNPTNGGILGLEFLQPTDRPPKLDLIDSDNEEIKQPLDKPPKLERISEPKPVQESSLDYTPKAESGINSSTSLENIQSVKDSLMKNKPVIHEKSSTSSPETGEPTFSKRKGQSPNKFKSHGSRKSEKLIVKTDFLKNKHPYKKKRKSEEKNGANIAQSTSNKSGSQSGFLNVQDKPGKRPRGDKKIEQNVSAVRAEQSPDQQADRSWKRHKSPGVDRSSHSPGVKKRKEKESHFEKTRKVPSVQEYLERKRELCKKRSETRTEPSESLGDLKHTAKRPSEKSGDSHLTLKRPLSPAKTNVTLKENRRSETPKGFNRKDRSQSRGPYEAGHQKRKESHKGQRVPENKTQNLKHSSSKDKIYLSPCDGSRRASCEGINLAKLQIRHSPDKPKHIERRRSLESSCKPKHSNSDLKTINNHKMLEFKLYPEFAHGSPTTQDKSMEATDPKSKNVVEAIKSSKEAWCNSIPFKKRKVESVEGQGFQKSPSSAGSTLNYKPLEKNAARPPQDSRTTFNVFKQMYHEKRSKSLDCSQGNS